MTLGWDGGFGGCKYDAVCAGFGKIFALAVARRLGAVVEAEIQGFWAVTELKELWVVFWTVCPPPAADVLGIQAFWSAWNTGGFGIGKVLTLGTDV